MEFIDMGLKEKVTIRGRVTLTLTDVKTGKKDIQIRDNLVVTLAKSAIAAKLSGDASIANRSEITFGAIGSGTTTPTLGDTTLETETFRKILATRTFSGNQATLRMFLSTSEGNGTIEEFALFGEDASVAADSGTMFNRVLVNRVKTSSNTLTIEVVLTIS